MIDVSFSLNYAELIKTITNILIFSLVVLLFIYLIYLFTLVLPKFFKKNLEVVNQLNRLMWLIKHCIVQVWSWFAISFYFLALFIKYQTNEINSLTLFFLNLLLGLHFLMFILRWYQAKRSWGDYYIIIEVCKAWFIASILCAFYYSQPIYWVSIGMSAALYLFSMSRQEEHIMINRFIESCGVNDISPELFSNDKNVGEKNKQPHEHLFVGEEHE